jgi:hypothetical protein
LNGRPADALQFVVLVILSPRNIFGPAKRGIQRIAKIG